MNQVRTFGSVLAALTVCAASASAQFSDGFESYASSASGTVFTTGPANAGGWKQWQAFANSHTLCFGSGAAIGSHGGSQFVGTQLNSDLVHEFALTSGFWDISMWTYVPGSASPNPMGDSQWLVLLNNYSDAGGFVWATQIEFDPSLGRVRADAGRSIVTNANQAVETPLVFDTWKQVRVEVDLTNNVATIFYDNIQMGDPFFWSLGPFGQNAATTIPRLGAIDLYANDTTVPGFMYWDDVSITTHVTTQPPTVYCTAGTTTNGCSASITANANPSVTFANSCNLSVANVEGQKSGLIFYSINGQQAQAWNATSFLCVKAPTQRTSTQTSGGTVNTCNGSLSLDWNAFQAANPSALGNPWTAGNALQAQAWFRDPPAGKSTNLSNAIELTYVP
jgi:hypothetical protein